MVKALELVAGGPGSSSSSSSGSGSQGKSKAADEDQDDKKKKRSERRNDKETQGKTGGGTNTPAADALAELTTGGLTFFAPVDDAWSDAAWEQVGREGVGARLLGNHVSCSCSSSFCRIMVDCIVLIVLSILSICSNHRIIKCRDFNLES